MKAKIIIVGLVSEHLVASFNSPAEAFHCASLLQASTENENLIYYVEYKDKGVKKRQMADCFTRRLPFLNKATKSNIKNYFL